MKKAMLITLGAAAAMVLASLGYCCYGMMFNDYSTNKAVIVFLVCLLKLVQAYTDVIHGNMQQKGRLQWQQRF